MAIEDKRIVIPNDMGKSIQLGVSETDKWDVKIDGSTIVRGEDGTLSAPLSTKPCVNMTGKNLNTRAGGLENAGIQCFYGVRFAVGLPRSFNNQTDSTQASANTASEFDDTVPNASPGVNWNGYQIASPYTITQYVMNDTANPETSTTNVGTAWVRTNNVGIGDDNLGTWTAWRRMTAQDFADLNAQLPYPRHSGNKDDWKIEWSPTLIECGGTKTIQFNNETEAYTAFRLPHNIVTCYDINAVAVDVPQKLGEAVHVKFDGQNNVTIYAHTNANYTGSFIVSWSAKGTRSNSEQG